MSVSVAPPVLMITVPLAGSGSPEWKVYVRVVPNEEGSTTTWTFMRPDGLTDEQFREQLKGFDLEVNNWKRYLEEN